MSDPRNSRGDSARVPRRFLVLCGMLVYLVRRYLLPRNPQGAEQPLAAGAGGYQPENPDTAFEPSDWSPGPVALIYIGILTLLVISCFVLIAAYPGALSDVDRNLSIAPPGPRLQIDPESAIRLFRADEERWLNTYYWIDKQKGIVHIPIAEAMKKLASKGAPGFPERQQ